MKNKTNVYIIELDNSLSESIINNLSTFIKEINLELLGNKISLNEEQFKIFNKKLKTSLRN